MTGSKLDGSVALVTGASSGIGEATAESLAGLGAKVALVARRADRLEELAARIRDAGGTALVVEADVTGRESAEQAGPGPWTSSAGSTSSSTMPA